MYQPGRDQLKR